MSQSPGEYAERMNCFIICFTINCQPTAQQLTAIQTWQYVNGLLL